MLCVCLQLCEAVIPFEGAEPRVHVYHERVEFVGSSKGNISILLYNITFEDEGEYICFARNPKEKNRNHSAIFTLIVVDQSKSQMRFLIYIWLFCILKNNNWHFYFLTVYKTFPDLTCYVFLYLSLQWGRLTTLWQP